MDLGGSPARPARGRRHIEFIHEYAAPFTLLVIADLEGVPEDDHGSSGPVRRPARPQMSHKPLEFLYDQFSAYVEDRRRTPRATS